MRWNSVAPSAEKKTKRSTPARSAARSRRAVARPFSSSTRAWGSSRIAAARWITVSRSAQRLALEVAVAEPRQVAERDLHLDPVAAQAARVADQRPHVVPGLEQQREQRPADGSARPGQQDHAADSTRARRLPTMSRSGLGQA